MRISLIAVVDERNGLGKDNQLLCHLPADLAHFKRVTLNKSVIMGYNTFLSIGKALPKRKNIVLTRKTGLQAENVFFVDSLTRAWALVESEETLIVGGASIYTQTIDQASCVYLTRIHHQFESDVFFPSMDESVWSLEKEQHCHRDEKNAYDYTFLVYERRRQTGD